MDQNPTEAALEAEALRKLYKEAMADLHKAQEQISLLQAEVLRFQNELTALLAQEMAKPWQFRPTQLLEKLTQILGVVPK